MTLRWWEDPLVTGAGRLPMHAVPHAPGLLLDGDWDFQLLPSPDSAPSGDWNRLPVPSCWTMHGVGDPPAYTNVAMPFPQLPPHVPAQNPTGVYRRRVDLPAEWDGRRVVLHVGAAESVLLVHVDGTLVAVGKDSHLATEVDLTPHVRDSSLLLELRVVKWSDASFVEDQDQWWHGGITRSVWLYATEAVHLRDVRLDADVLPGLQAARLSCTVDVAFPGGLPLPGHRIRVSSASLGWSATEELLAQPEPAPAVGADEQRRVHETWLARPPQHAPDDPLVRAWRDAERRDRDPRRVRVAHDVTAPRLWSHEDPHLHDVEVQLLGPAGELLDRAAYRVGFRRVELSGRELLVNGVAVLLRGVNRHDAHPTGGRVVTDADLRADLLAMRAFGFNAVRTAHYPNAPAFLDLCDELGLYVVAEADLEAHAHRGALCDDPRYLPAFVDRVSRMVLRDRNHASVLAWSLGNESGSGANARAAAAWVRAHDPSRPLHYEGALSDDWDAGADLTDLVCPMYPSVEALLEQAATGREAPVVMCEYSHAMGNSNGGLSDYWDAIERTPGLQGGFVWEWRDHGIVQPLPDGRSRVAYGGDFGESVHDGAFCLDGLLHSDGTPKPAAYEHRQLACPLRLEGDVGDLRVRSALAFIGVDRLEVTGEVVDEGGSRACWPVALPAVAPGEAAPLDLRPPDLELDGEAWLSLHVRESGQPRGVLQRRLTPPAPYDDRVRPGASVQLDDDALLDWGPLVDAPDLVLWRAPTDNDVWGRVAELWDEWGLRSLGRRVTRVVHEDGAARVECVWTTAAGIEVPGCLELRALEDGVGLRLAVDVPAVLRDLPRVGLRWSVPVARDTMTWWGRGPHEAYPDRARSAAVGRWHSPVGELLVPYARPQECGGRAEVRWFALDDEDDALVTRLDVPRQVSVLPYDAPELARAAHLDELPEPSAVVVHVDAAHRGLGTASCGPDTAAARRVAPGRHELRAGLRLASTFGR